MEPQIIIVHNIDEAIKDVGIMPYANTIVQEMGGDYYYIEVEEVKRPQEEHKMTSDDMFYSYEKIKGKNKGYYKYRAWLIPNRLAWFIIDCLKLKSQVACLGSNEYREGKQAVYLTPGKKLFGHTIKKLTEIPAELMPVVVERL